MKKSQKKIIIIDDHPLIRRGFADLIAMDSDFLLVGEASGGAEGVALANELKPDIILLDLNMGEINGLEVLQQLKLKQPHCHVIIITVSSNEEDIISALRLGASGYLLKDMEPEEILQHIKRVAEGNLAFGGKVSELMVKGLQKDTIRRQREDVSLTKREQQVLQGIANGLSNKQIANQLDIVESTVKVHVKHLFQKLKCNSRTEIAIWAVSKEEKPS